jgi:hypothetical protein
LLIVEMDEVLATFVGTHSKPLLWEGSILFDAPDLEDPIRVQSVNTATCLVAYHVDDRIVLERGPGAQVHGLKALGCSDVELIELVLCIQAHNLPKLVDCLKALWQDTLNAELKLLEHREQELGDRSRLISSLNGAAYAKRFAVAERRLDDVFHDSSADELGHVS